MSALLNKLGAAETDNPEREIIGLTDDGTLVLPDEPPKQKPIGKVKSFSASCRTMMSELMVFFRKRNQKQNAVQVQRQKVIIERQKSDGNLNVHVYTIELQ